MVVSADGNAHLVATARTFTGVDQSSPFGTVATDSNGDANDLSAAITIPADGLGYDAGVQNTERMHWRNGCRHESDRTIRRM